MNDYTTKFFYLGETIFNEGAAGDTAYLVRSGRVSVYRTVAGERLPLADFGPGDIFGEMAILMTGPRTATAEMAEAGDLILLPKHRFNEQLEEVPVMVKTLFMSLLERLLLTTQRLRPEHESSVFLSVCRVLDLQLDHLQAARLKALPYREALRTVQSILPVSTADVEDVFFKLQALGLVVCHKDGVPAKSLVFVQADGFLAACERYYDQHADHFLGESQSAASLDLGRLPKAFGIDAQALLAAAAAGAVPQGLMQVDQAALLRWLKDFPEQAQGLRSLPEGLDVTAEAIS